MGRIVNVNGQRSEENKEKALRTDNIQNTKANRLTKDWDDELHKAVICILPMGQEEKKKKAYTRWGKLSRKERNLAR